MKVFRFIIPFILFCSLSFADKIAVATKVKGEVELMKVGKKKFIDLKPGTILDDGDKIRTGRTGFAAVIFIDDKSTLKLKEDSEVVITGQRTAASISKKINMDGGTIRATVKKQNTDFVIQTPTSVASVKGTDFWMITNPEMGDILIGLEGLVNLTNLASGESTDVGAGNTGTSSTDGTVETSETNPDDIPSDPDEDDATSNQIEIEMEGPDGEIKTLLIDIQ